MHASLRAFGLCLLIVVSANAQSAPRRAANRQPPPADPVVVDRNGIIRWSADGREVALFGVNYAAPFAYDYQSIEAMSLDHKRAIDADVAHLARLGVDAYRIHVWDREVTDSLGNLLQNVHLDLFDYLLSRLAARGIKVILTPIAWWGPGYPAPDHPSPGFANRYSKPRMLVDSVARRASVRYLAQFVQHVNPYTQQSFGEDPNIIAMEVFNEPWHDLAPPVETTRYINEMVASMRGAGYRRPIFYNISEHYSPAHGAAVCAADIQGVSAQWYPTGLVRGEALPGNPLPNVDRYPLPWKQTPGCASKAHMVYEFDGADVNIPVMYPAMARAFRGAGFQWATQFAYDPLAVAYSNTEYQTHFLNLVYSPAKAISFLIAGEAFRRTPRGFDAGTYPASEQWGDFRISFGDRRSELVNDSLFYHTGSTPTRPPSAARIRHIAGVGGSSLVTYGGSGAYFLDRLGSGMWRLEVYPDAVPVEDPHSRGSLKRSVTRIYWRTQPMHIDLPDLGTDFVVQPFNPGNDHRPTVRSGSMGIRPGVYLVMAAAHSNAMGMSFGAPIEQLREFHAPPSSDGPTVVRHIPPPSVAVGGSFSASFDIVQASAPDSALLFVRYSGWQGYRRAQRLELDANSSPYTYASAVSADTGRTGTLEYVVSVFSGGKAVTYPGALEGAPNTWDFTGTQFWTTRAVPREAPIVLFDADRDRSRVVWPGYVPGAQTRSEWIAGSTPEHGAWLMGVDAFGPTATAMAFRSMLRDGTRARVASESSGSLAGLSLRVKLRAQGASDIPIGIAMILTDGTAWGTTVRVGTAWQDVEIPLQGLARVPLVLLPRPFPSFLPWDLTVGTTATAPDLRMLDGVQWSFSRAAGMANDAALRLEIESVHLVSSRGSR